MPPAAQMIGYFKELAFENMKEGKYLPSTSTSLSLILLSKYFFASLCCPQT